MPGRQPLFDLAVQGAIVINGDTWVDLGLIPDGDQIMLGFATYSPEGKPITFSLYTNKTGESTGVKSLCDIQDRVRVKDGDAKDRDYYRNAKTSRKSVVSTGVEHWWLFLDMKGNNATDIFYWIDYAEV